MPRSKEQFEAMREATNEKIITAAIPLFSQKGIAGTVVQEIADKAGISIGLLYRHYKTKNDILTAIVRTAISGLAEVGAAFNHDPLEVMKWWVRDILNDIQSSGEFVHMVNIMTPANIADENFPCRDELLASHFSFRQTLADLITRGQNTGLFHSGDPTAMALLFLTMVDGLCSMKLALGDGFISPNPWMLTAFLLKEEYNHYD